MIRVGLGYDIHRVTPGRPMILGGVSIPSPAGLSGHSDADVLLHALMDALLGAAALGDIGTHFPPTDDQYHGISSLELLGRVRALIEKSGYRIGNLDVTLVAEQPKIGPYAKGIEENICRVLGLQRGQVGIKATTNEGVGPEGRGEAISAHAVALLLGST